MTEWTISIHAAREGGDDGNAVRRVFEFGFQSTPPVKAATCVPTSSRVIPDYFNPRRP